MSQRIYNFHCGNGAPAAMYYYLKLRGKHCRKPHCRNGVVDTLGQYSILGFNPESAIKFRIYFRSKNLTSKRNNP